MMRKKPEKINKYKKSYKNFDRKYYDNIFCTSVNYNYTMLHY